MKKLKQLASYCIFLVLIIAFSACGTQAESPSSPYETPIEEHEALPLPEEQNPNNPEQHIPNPTQIYNHETIAQPTVPQPYYTLPAPRPDGDMSVERALANRRSRRDFMDTALSIEQLSQLLWAAYGITLPMDSTPWGDFRGGFRTTPSAGATFPLEVYVVVGNVHGLSPGIFIYNSEDHTITRLADGDVREQLRDIALGQQMVADAPITIFYSSVMHRITERYGERGIRYAYMELGHSAQNVYLQAEALGLGTVAIGAFDDSRIISLFGLAQGEEPLYLMPVGHYY